jgi:hypothetical protein
MYTDAPAEVKGLGRIAYSARTHHERASWTLVRTRAAGAGRSFERS